MKNYTWRIPDSEASALSTLASVVGTPSPLSGIHQWFTNMALTIAQARADAMLDRNCTPEPLRTGL
ncbi:MAG: hypothetical protein LBD43_02160, partial [Holosporales bacterium]|nr:hypothetical protein [Holosporales bacterium]